MNSSARTPVFRRATTTLVAAALALPMRMASASEPASSTASIELDLDLNADLDSRAEHFEKRVPQEFKERAKAAGWTIKTSARMQLVVQVGAHEKSDIDYDYVVSSKIDGMELTEARVAGTCKRCVEEAVVRTMLEPALDKQFAALAAKLDDPARVDEPPTTGPSEPAGAEPQAPRVTTGDDKLRLKPLGKAGIGVMVGGAVMLGIGIGVAVAGGESEVDPENAQRDREQDLRIPGGVVAGIGGALLVAGITMLAVDARRARKRRATVRPTVSTHSGGVVFRLVF